MVHMHASLARNDFTRASKTNHTAYAIFRHVSDVQFIDMGSRCFQLNDSMLFAHISEGIAYSNHFDYYGECLSHEKASLIPATISPGSSLTGVSISGEESSMWPSGYQCSLNAVCN